MRNSSIKFIPLLTLIVWVLNWDFLPSSETFLHSTQSDQKNTNVFQIQIEIQIRIFSRSSQTSTRQNILHSKFHPSPFESITYPSQFPSRSIRTFCPLHFHYFYLTPTSHLFNDFNLTQLFQILPSWQLYYWISILASDIFYVLHSYISHLSQTLSSPFPDVM